MVQGDFETEVTATHFKTRCLTLLDHVAESGEVICVTKNGRVIAEVHPVTEPRTKFAEAGFAKNEMKIVGDIMKPIDVERDALE